MNNTTRIIQQTKTLKHLNVIQTRLEGYSIAPKSRERYAKEINSRREQIRASRLKRSKKESNNLLK